MGPRAKLALVVAALAAGLVVVAGALASPWLRHDARRAREVALLVVDKTVPLPDPREHAALLWHLDHRKLRGPHGPWRAERDYLGFDPRTCRGERVTPAALRGRRLVYLADTYGVYRADYADAPDAPCARLGRGADDALARSERIDGGLSLAEVRALAAFRDRGGGVVAEFDSLETPTYPGPASAALGRVVGGRYLGWVGRWYEDLAAEGMPRWMRERFRARTGRAWRFAGPGLVLAGDLDERLAVVPASELDAERPVTVHRTAAGRRDPLSRSIRDGARHWYWFSGTAPLPGARVLATFRLRTSARARAALAEQGFPAELPAVVRAGGGSGRGLGAYLAADLADIGGELPPRRDTVGLDGLERLRARHAPAGSRWEAFWDVAVPLWDAMVAEAGAIRG